MSSISLSIYKIDPDTGLPNASDIENLSLDDFTLGASAMPVPLVCPDDFPAGGILRVLFHGAEGESVKFNVDLPAFANCDNPRGANNYLPAGGIADYGISSGHTISAALHTAS